MSVTEALARLDGFAVADEPLAPRTTYKVGGSAAVFATPRTLDELRAVSAVAADTGLPVVVLTTIRFHGRTREAVLERYGGGEERPDGVEAFPVEGFQETILWLPEPRALVPGDLLIGDGEGGIRMCPESSLRGWYVDMLLTNRSVSARQRQRWVDTAVQALVAGRAEW